MGWSPNLWQTLMYLATILASSAIFPANGPQPPSRPWRITSLTCRGLVLATLVWLAFAWRGGEGERMVTLWPFTLRAQWWGILRLICMISTLLPLNNQTITGQSPHSL